MARISVGRRIELARRIREIGRKVEFLEAGQDPREKLEAAVLAAEIDRVYLEWGLDGDRRADDRRGGGDAGGADREGADGSGERRFWRGSSASAG